MTKNPRCQILLTSRPDEYHGSPIKLTYNRQEQEFELTGFDTRQIGSFIESWCATDSVKAIHLREEITSRVLWKIQAHNPRILSILCFVGDTPGQLPAQQYRFYEQVTNNLLMNFPRADHEQVSKEEYRDILRLLLQKVAWNMITLYRHDPGCLSLPALHNLISDTLDEERIQLQMLETLPLSEIVGDIEATLTAISPLWPDVSNEYEYYTLDNFFLDYLVASYLAHQSPSLRMGFLMNGRQQLSHWQEISILLAGQLDDATPLIEGLLTQANSDFRSALLAGCCLIEVDEKMVPQALVGQVTERLLVLSPQVSFDEKNLAISIVVQLLGKILQDAIRADLWDSSSTIAQRCAAAWLLGRLGNIQIVDDLMVILWEDDKDTYGLPNDTVYLRCAAAWALGWLGDGRATEELVKVLENKDEAVPVRCAVAWALGQLKEERTIGVLEACFHDKNPFIQISSIWAAGQIADTRIVKTLAPLLQDTPVGWTVMDALENIGEAAASETLSLLADKHSRADKRWMAVQLLGKIGNSKEVVIALLEALDDPDKSIRQAAAEALGYQGATQAIGALLQRIKDEDEDEQTHKYVGQALKMLNDRGEYSIVGQVVALLLDRLEPEAVREAAARVLGILRDRRAIEALLVTLRDHSSSVRREGVLAIGMLADRNDAEIANATAELLFDESFAVRREVVQVLGRIGNPEAMRRLIAFLFNRKERKEIEEQLLRLDISEVLGRLGNVEGIELLRYIVLNDPDETVKSLAIAALERIPISQIRNIFWEICQKYNEGIGWRAVEVLGTIGDTRVLGKLLSTLHDKDPLRRSQAVTLLGQSTDERAMDGLLEALHDKDFIVVVAAIRALGRKEEPQAIQALEEALQSNHSVIRREAAVALGKKNDPHAAVILLETVKDPTENVKLVGDAIQTLSQLGSLEAMKDLIAELWDKRTSIRYRAAEALAEVHVGLVCIMVPQKFQSPIKSQITTHEAGR